MCTMDFRQRLDGLQLDNDVISDNQVETVTTNLDSFEMNLDHLLGFICQLTICQGHTHRLLVSCFREARSKACVNREGSPNDVG